MPTFTSPYNLAMPLVNNATDQDLWGGELNNNMQIINDTFVSLASMGIPTGSIFTFAANIAPTGFLALDGSLISRTTYADLWTYAQSSGNVAANDAAWTLGEFSPGDGSTTFRIPDPRGQFIRDWDNGAGIDPTRAIGSTQADAIKSHNLTVTDPGHSHGITGYQTLVEQGSLTANAQAITPITINTDSAATGISVAYTGAAETRPTNIAWLMCIKT